MPMKIWLFSPYGVHPAGGKTHLGAFQRGHVPVQPRRADAPDHADVHASRQLAGGADPFIGDLAGSGFGVRMKRESGLESRQPGGVRLAADTWRPREVQGP